MELRTDWSKAEVVALDEVDWVPSPSPGVDRRMLDRIGGEVARATTVVRYAPGSRFPTHTHGGGEEFLVLDGVFSDEHGDFPAGSYVRNPIGSAHAPFTEGGCTIFVKLRQMVPGEETLRVRDASGPLFEDAREVVSVLQLDPGDAVDLAGAEALLVDGEARLGERRLSGRTWLRHPPGAPAQLVAATPATVWVKEFRVWPPAV